MFSNILGGHYGSEDMKTEFKTFCLKTAETMTLSDAEDILINKIWDKKLSYEINKTIKKYFSSVFPKYVSSFSNSDVNGDFIIGINDFGEITGIPFYGKIDESIMKDMLEKVVQKCLCVDTGSGPGKQSAEHAELMLKNIHLELIPLEKNKRLIADEYSVPFNEYKKQYINRNNKLLEYNQKRLSWLNELAKYSTKLTTLINTTETREDIIKYIIKNSENNSKHKKIIEVLKTDEYIAIPKFDELSVRKIDTDDVLYWLVTYKDDMTELTCLKRPHKPNFNKVYTPLQIVQKLSLVRSIFMDIEEVQYYMIKITIKGENIPGEVYYKEANDWKIRYRKCSEEGPYSE